MNTPANPPKTAADVVDNLAKTSTEVTVPKPAAVIITDHRPEDDFADVRKRDIMTPRLSLLQPTSPVVIESNGAYRGGQFIDGTNIICDNGKSFKFIAIDRWLHWTEWNPDRNAPKDQRILSRSFDINSWQAKEAESFVKVKGPDGKEKLKITEHFNYIICLPGDNNDFANLYLWNFARSSHKTGKIFLNRLMRARQADGSQAAMYMNMYEMSSVLKQKDQNRWFEPVIGPSATPITDADSLAELKELVIGFKNRREEMKRRVLERELEEAAEIAAHKDDGEHF